MGISIKVSNVKPLDDLYLLVEFENGVSKHYDIKQLIPQFPVYKDLLNYDIWFSA
jgi:hypothetical protein